MRRARENTDGAAEYDYDCPLCGDGGWVLLPYGEPGDRNVYATLCPGLAEVRECPHAARAAHRWGWNTDRDFLSRLETRSRLESHNARINVNPALAQPQAPPSWRGR